DSITSNWAHAKLHNLVYENAQLRARVFENTSESMNNTSGMSVTPHVDKPKLSAVTPHSKKLHASIPSHFVPQPREFNVVKHRNVIAPGMFKINQRCLYDHAHDREDVNFPLLRIKEYFDSVSITHETYAAKTPQQNEVVERRNRTLVEAARTMLIFSHAPLFLWAEVIATACYTQNHFIIHRCFNKTPYELIQGRKPDISDLHVFGALCYSKNDRDDIGKLGAKGDIGFFIGYSANYAAYRVDNRRTKKIMETMNVTFDELSAMAFEQNSSRPDLQSMTFGQISSELELTYAPSKITPQSPSKRDLDILLEPLHNEYLGGRPSEEPRTVHVAPVLQNLHAPTTSMSFQDFAPVPTNSSNTPVSSHNVDVQS
nr:hypothetical protein [Tanacetum cinerariifolium]